MEPSAFPNTSYEPRSRKSWCARSRAEGEAPTIHALAHSIARILEQDHLRMSEQLERAGIRLRESGG
jgi:hypothetical protein